VAGADISLTRNSTDAFAGIVVLNARTLEIADEYFIKGKIEFPYIPGLLSFREAPLLLKLFKKVSPAPQLVFFDGQGIAHPRRLGLASHMGLLLDCPTIGCAKSRLTGNYKEPGLKKGSRSRLQDDGNQTIGAVVRTLDPEMHLPLPHSRADPPGTYPGQRISSKSLVIPYGFRATTKHPLPPYTVSDCSTEKPACSTSSASSSGRYPCHTLDCSCRSTCFNPRRRVSG